MRRWIVVLVLVGVAGGSAWGQEQLPPILESIDLAMWADRFEAQMDVLSVLPPAQRQTQFVDYMRDWREELMPVMVVVRMLPEEQRAELGRRVRSAVVTEVGVERAAELQARWQGEMEYQRGAFQALDEAGRQALMKRFWSGPETAEPDPLKTALNLSDAEWDIIGDLISRIRKVQQEEAQARQEHRRVLARLLQDPASEAKAFVAEFKAMAEKAQRYRKQLAELRDALRPLVTIRQEVILVVQDILD
jgi:Spy/CpxP family protein refolding chaperone